MSVGLSAEVCKAGVQKATLYSDQHGIAILMPTHR